MRSNTVRTILASVLLVGSLVLATACSDSTPVDALQEATSDEGVTLDELASEPISAALRGGADNPRFRVQAINEIFVRVENGGGSALQKSICMYKVNANSESCATSNSSYTQDENWFADVNGDQAHLQFNYDTYYVIYSKSSGGSDNALYYRLATGAGTNDMHVDYTVTTEPTQEFHNITYDSQVTVSTINGYVKSISVSGVSTIIDRDYQGWDVSATTGGSNQGSITYKWYRRFEGSSWSLVGTGTTYYGGANGEYEFSLRVDAYYGSKKIAQSPVHLVECTDCEL